MSLWVLLAPVSLQAIEQFGIVPRENSAGAGQPHEGLNQAGSGSLGGGGDELVDGAGRKAQGYVSQEPHGFSLGGAGVTHPPATTELLENAHSLEEIKGKGLLEKPILQSKGTSRHLF